MHVFREDQGSISRADMFMKPTINPLMSVNWYEHQLDLWTYGKNHHHYLIQKLYTPLMLMVFR